MSGVNYQPNYGSGFPPATSAVGPLPGGPGFSSPAGPIPGPPVAQDAYAPVAIDQELLKMRQMLASGSPAESTVAIYRLESLAATHRAHVLPLLLEQLGSHNHEIATRAAIDVLYRLRAPEALGPFLELSRSGRSPSVQVAAASAYNALTGAAAAPASTPAPVQPPIPYPPPGPYAQPSAYPPPPGYPAPAPVQPPIPYPTQPAPGTVDPNYLASLLPRLLDPAQAPAAAVELAKLPTPAVLHVTGQLLNGYAVDPRTQGLVATILAHRARDPQAAQQLRGILAKGDVRASRALSKAALGLMATRNPAYLPDLLRFLTLRSPELIAAKRVILEKMVHDRQVLSLPAIPVVAQALLHEQESPELAATASALLSRSANPRARDVLAASPLFASPDPRLRMQAVMDLGAHPPPYPAVGMQALTRLAQDRDPSVAAQARELLSMLQ